MEKDFEREFNKIQKTGDVAYSLREDPVFMSYLEAQFNTAPMKRDVDKYWLKFYTEAELDKGLMEANSKIPESNARNGYVMANHIPSTEFEIDIRKKMVDFFEMKESEVPQDCFTHDITKTPVYIHLKAIDKKIDDFRKHITNVQIDYFTHAKEVAKDIIAEVSKIDNYPLLQEKVLRFIINNDENIYLDIEQLNFIVGEKDNSEKRTIWKTLKMYLNNSLREQVCLPENTPQQQKGIDSDLTFNDLFPSVADKDMVLKMLEELKIINQEGKYLLGRATGMIRVFIDVMKEEGCFVDIDRKPILRVFTPKILGRRVETIKEPQNYDSIKRKILNKLAELRK